MPISCKNSNILSFCVFFNTMPGIWDPSLRVLSLILTSKLPGSSIFGISAYDLYNFRLLHFLSMRYNVTAFFFMAIILYETTSACFERHLRGVAY